MLTVHPSCQSIDRILSSSSTYPKEHFLYLRSVSELFTLLDSSITNDSVFRSRVVSLAEAQKIFRVYPFVPVEYELVYSAFDILKLAPTWSIVADTKPYTMRRGGCKREA